MKIDREEQKFKPVTITLETPEEIAILWEIAERFHQDLPFKSVGRHMLVDISNYFSTKNYIQIEGIEEQIKN